MNPLKDWRFVVLLALAPTAFAQPSDEAFLDELMEAMDESTALADEGRLNADYVPGMVTVLDARRQQALGARTVFEALAWVPGVLNYRANSGEPFLTVRGISFPFNSGNIKILIDGVAMNRETSGVSGHALLMPLSQVERIEMTRGPGAVLYGDFAFNGVVNIITREETQMVFAQVEDPQVATTGVIGRWGDPADGFALSVNLSGSQSDEPEIPQDNSQDTDRRGFGHIRARYRDFSLSFQSVRRKLESRRRPAAEETSDAWVAAHEREWRQGLSSRLALTHLSTKHETPGRNFDGDELNFDGQLDFEQSPRQFWRLRLGVVDSHTDEAAQPGPGQMPGQPPGQGATIRVRDIDRQGWGLGVQHEADVGRLGLTLGLRYDYRDAIDEDRLTPRIGLVWRATEQHLFKLQYTEGFRAPTFFELFPRPNTQSDLELETIATTELSYIYRRASQVLRLTSFYSAIEDMIFPAGPGVFANAAEGYSRGAEAEIETQWGATRLFANASYVGARTNRGRPDGFVNDPDSARWLANLGLLHDFGAAGTVGLHLNHFSERESPDPRVGDQNLLHLSYSLSNVLLPGLDLRLGLRNLLRDAEQSVLNVPLGVQLRTYHERRATLDIAYRF